MTTLTHHDLYVLGFSKGTSKEFKGLLCGLINENQDWARQFMAVLDIPLEWELVESNFAGIGLHFTDPRIVFKQGEGGPLLIDSITIESEDQVANPWRVQISDRYTDEFHYIELTGSIDTPERVAALEALGYVQVKTEEAVS